jgi:nucleotide-binding universal stress UspA family protein
MKIIKTVFVAHDFSPASRNALEIAAGIAKKTGSKLFIYHVVSTTALTDQESVYVYSPEKDLKVAGALLRRGITYLKKKYTHVNIAFEIDFGFVMPAITDKVAEVQPWLTVVGVKKRTGLDRVIFGDVCTTLIGKLKSPMLVIPLNYKVLKLNTITYAWDGKSSEIHPLSVIKEILTSDKNHIIALNVTHYDEEVERHAAQFKSGLRKMFPTQLTELQQVQGLDKETEFEKALRKINPDILVVYAHHYNFWQNMFHKRFSKHALKFSQSPVIVVSESH